MNIEEQIKKFGSYGAYQDSLVNEEDKEEYEKYKKTLCELRKKRTDNYNKSKDLVDDSEEDIKMHIKRTKITALMNKIKEIIKILKDEKYKYDK